VKEEVEVEGEVAAGEVARVSVEHLRLRLLLHHRRTRRAPSRARTG
jgi:hypothetical protein